MLPHNPDTRTASQVITKIETLQYCARMLTIAGVAVSAAILITRGGDTTAMLTGLHILNLAFTMLVAAGALHGHKNMIVQEQRTQELLREHTQQTAAQLNRLAGLEQSLLEIARKRDDELGRRRSNG